jgi:hypothetical protein
MNLLFCLALVFSASIAQINSEKFSFEGYLLLRVFPETPAHLQLLAQWEHNEDFDLWSSIKKNFESVTVLLSPVAFNKYTHEFNSNNITFSILQTNIQEVFDEQEVSLRSPRAGTIVGKFARYSEIKNYIDTMVSDHPNLCKSYVAGKTHESRNLKVITIGTSTSQKKIWIDCGIHAREWIAPSTCVWIIDKLVSEYNAGDASTVALLDYYEFHILPVLNPDGYEYTFNTYRMWRKNRKPNSGSSCVGTDLNRNWGYKWMTGGSSNNPCSDTYAGPKADSELETQAVEKAIQSRQNWAAYLTIHTYGLWWFTTWGYTQTLPPNYSDLYAKAKLGSEAIQSVYGTRYTYGSSSNILYIGSGGSEDWAEGVAKIKYAFCLELRPGQTGTDSFYGFSLPENRAPLVGAETYHGIKAFVKSIDQ